MNSKKLDFLFLALIPLKSICKFGGLKLGIHPPHRLHCNHLCSNHHGLWTDPSNSLLTGLPPLAHAPLQPVFDGLETADPFNT